MVPYKPGANAVAARCMDCEGWIKRPRNPASGGRPQNPRTSAQVRWPDDDEDEDSGPIALATASEDSGASQRDWHDDVYGSTGLLVLGRRRRPGKLARDRILEAQGNRCFYCRLPFGGVIYRRSRPVTLRLEWDHVLPFSYSLDNRPANFVAACHVCNGIKGALYFDTPAKAAAYIDEHRIFKGYRLLAPV